MRYNMKFNFFALFAYIEFILYPKRAYCFEKIDDDHDMRKWAKREEKDEKNDNMSLNNAPNLAIYMKIEKKSCRRLEKTINWIRKEISFACYERRPFYWFLISICVRGL